MKIKPDPIESLHKRRKKELELVFNPFPEKAFSRGLEVGAGDGFQSTILAKYVGKLVCTEYFADRLAKRDIKNVKYKACDAEKIEDSFRKNEFDLVFSSSLIEHLVNRKRFLQGVFDVLKDDGLAVHSLPNRFWKFSQMKLHHFNYFILFLEYLTGTKRKKRQENNPKHGKKYSVLRRLIWPVPHGAYKNNIKEFVGFGRKRWIKLFENNGFKVVKVIKGPVSSGYSLGFERIRKLFEALGFSSIDIYITIKKKGNSNYLEYLK